MDGKELSPSVVQLFSTAAIDSALGSSVSSQSSYHQEATTTTATTTPKRSSGSSRRSGQRKGPQPQTPPRFANAAADSRKEQQGVRRNGYAQQKQPLFKTSPASNKVLPPRFQDRAAVHRDQVLGPRFRGGQASRDVDRSGNEYESARAQEGSYNKTQGQRYGVSGFGNGGRSPPRSPAARSLRGSTSSSSPSYRKQNSAPAVMQRFNNDSYDNHSDSSMSASTRSQQSRGGYVKLATLISPEQEMQRNHFTKGRNGGRRRNGPSFSSMMTTGKNSGLFAGSAASPDATALPQPPKAWITDKNETASSADKQKNDMIARMFSSISKNGNTENKKKATSANKRNKVAKKPANASQPPAPVQQFFAQLVNTGTLVSIAA